MSIKYIIEREIRDTYTEVKDWMVKEYKAEILKEQKEKEVWITTHSGKLKGIQSINTNSLSNPYCIERSKNPKSICSRCYSNTFLKLREGLKNHLEHNSKLLSSKILPKKDLPLINALYFRFQSFGDLINMTHLRNLVRIARKNPKVNFALWTKRTDLIKQYLYHFDILNDIEFPPNIIVIYSNPMLDAPMFEVPNGFDKVFQVFNRDFVEKEIIFINCGANNCLECKKCYEFNNTYIINELVK